MKNSIITFFSISFLLACQQGDPTKQLAEEDEIVSRDTVFVENDAPTSTIKPYNRDSLTKYFHPSLTAWGGLTIWHDKNEIRIIEAKHSAELGYHKRIFYLNKGRIIRAEIEDHIADWQAFFDKYGENAAIEDSNMIYVDYNKVYDSIDASSRKSKDEEKIENEGNQILTFLIDEDLFIKNK